MADPTGWSWELAEMRFSDRCKGCQQSLANVAEVVRWTDKDLWHVGCLLNKLAAVDVLLAPEPGEEDTAASVSHWGLSAP